MIQSYSKLMPSSATIFKHHEFNKSNFRSHHNKIAYEVFASSVAGANCDKVLIDMTLFIFL